MFPIVGVIMGLAIWGLYNHFFYSAALIVDIELSHGCRAAKWGLRSKPRILSAKLMVGVFCPQTSPSLPSGPQSSLSFHHQASTMLWYAPEIAMLHDNRAASS